jgi:hypothetical protein
VSATRRRARTGFRPRHLFALAGALLLVLVTGSFYAAFTASATVAPSSVGYQSSAFSVANLKPTECTNSITSVVAGSGTINATAQNQLVLGSSSADTVTLQKNDCFVGGGPTSGTKDSVTGQNGSNNGDQCIVTSGASVTRCTLVATRP